MSHKILSAYNCRKHDCLKWVIYSRYTEDFSIPPDYTRKQSMPAKLKYPVAWRSLRESVAALLSTVQQCQITSSFLEVDCFLEKLFGISSLVLLPKH